MGETLCLTDFPLFHYYIMQKIIGHYSQHYTVPPILNVVDGLFRISAKIEWGDLFSLYVSTVLSLKEKLLYGEGEWGGPFAKWREISFGWMMLYCGGV